MGIGDVLMLREALGLGADFRRPELEGGAIKTPSCLSSQSSLIMTSSLSVRVDNTLTALMNSPRICKEGRKIRDLSAQLRDKAKKKLKKTAHSKQSIPCHGTCNVIVRLKGVLRRLISDQHGQSLKQTAEIECGNRPRCTID